MNKREIAYYIILGIVCLGLWVDIGIDAWRNMQ